MDEIPPSDSPDSARDATLLASMGDCLQSLDALLGQANRRLRILDDALKQQDWEGPARAARLREFLLGGRQRRVEILLRDGRFLQDRCPLLMDLLRHFADQIEVRIMDEHERFEDCFVLADDTGLLHRYHHDDWRGRLALDDRAGAFQLGERFTAAWQRASGQLGYAPLGL